MGRPSRAVVLGGSLLVVATAGLALWRGSRPAPPNIVLVVWDTCRGDRVTPNGFPRPTTPRLEELASGGTTFRRCFTPSPWTPPAHASLFTGLLPRNHGLRERLGDRVRPGVPLLAETLREAGYETVCAVANPMISGVTGLDAGFERVFRCFREPEVSGSGEDVRRGIREWLASRSGGSGRPLFLFVNLMEPHLPYRFDAASVAAVHGDAAVNGARTAAAGVGETQANHHLLGIEKVPEATVGDLGRAYDGAVHAADRATAEILGLLRTDGLLEGAFVAVCGDHGENLGEHGELNHIMSVYEPVLHVPLVLRWPGRFEGGRVEDAEVRLQDLYPTILEAAGVEAPAPCGKDALALTESPLRPRTLVAEYGPPLGFLPSARRTFPTAPAEAFERFHLGLLAVREPASVPGARKFLRVTRHEEGGGSRLLREELYDLEADPGERNNLMAPAADPGERARADRLRATGLRGR